MATVPLSATNIRLLSNVPFNSDYKHSRWFTNKSSQTNYFLTKPVVHSIQQANFQRIEGKHFISVKKSIDELWGTNYLMFQNSNFSNKWFYAFVTKLEYRQINTTHVHFEIDVLQTWKFDMNFKPSYVVREHRKLWNSDGTPVINTIDEGLDYGTDYETVDVTSHHPYGLGYLFLVVAMKESRHGSHGQASENDIEPSWNGIPQPLSYYIHPFRKTGAQPNFKVGDKVAQGNTDILNVLKGFSKSEDAVNNVVTAYITEFISDEITLTGNTFNFNSPTFELVSFGSEGGFDNFDTIYAKNMRINVEKDIPVHEEKYARYHNVKESKLLMYPYTVLILDDFKGNRIELKNEYIDGNNITINVRGSAGTSNMTTYAIKNYLTTEKLNMDSDRNLMALEQAIINNAPSDIPVINEFLSAFMQGNRNSINTQRSQAFFNSLMSVAGSTISGVGAFTQKNPSIVGQLSAGAGIVKGAGDGVLQIQQIQSKLKDIENTPPQISRMGSNTNFNFGNQLTGVRLIKKQIHKEYRKILSDFFNMYGYKTNEVKIPNFRTRKYWNYVETENCVITGNFNNEDLQELKNVFDNGITLWHTDDIGNYSLENEVI